jgi:hypothetical protein
MVEKVDLTRLEILKMARELVINEYIDRRAQEHNEWLDKSTQMWKTNRVTLAYPTIPPYPTEKEIITRAKTLLQFLKEDDENVEGEEATHDEEFSNELEYTNLSNSVIKEQLDGAMDCIDTELEETKAKELKVKDENYPEEKSSNKMPGIMKTFQDIRGYLNERKL